MTPRLRKLIGTVALLLFLGLYIWVAAAIGSGRIAEASGVVQFAYFVLAGLLWVIPAGFIVRWMQRAE